MNPEPMTIGRPRTRKKAVLDAKHIDILDSRILTPEYVRSGMVWPLSRL